MKYFYTYSDDVFKNNREILLREAVCCNWFDKCTALSQNDLSKDFKEKFNHILRHSKGGGYWIWKPYVIKTRLDMINDGDFLIYIDAGCKLNSRPEAKKRFDEYINMLNNSDKGLIAFQLEHPEYKYTKKEILDYFNIRENDDEILNSGQLVGGIQVIKKNQHSVKLINEWYDTLVKCSSLFTDEKSKKQDSRFIDNRHDQSVFSIIRKKHGAIVLPDETFFKQKHKWGGFGEDTSLKCPFWACRKK